jgi:TrkA domain protein
MTDIEEEDLPGIGKKFTLHTISGGRVVVILHTEGRRDIYYHKDDSDEEPSVVTLSDEEARKVSSILGDAYFKTTPIMSVKQTLSEDSKALRIPKGSKVIGKKIQDMDVRKRTGASIVAIIRGEEILNNPSAKTVLKANDLLMVIGTAENVKKLERLVNP